jgi:hypothetical protein
MAMSMIANESSQDGLKLFEIPPWLVRPALEACRLFNTALDTAFYDVPVLIAELRADGEEVVTLRVARAEALKRLDLGALANPEGSLLVIDAAGDDHVDPFHDVEQFLDSPWAETIRVASITGVGSSALGSAALAWNASAALGVPVLAIVPGYGVADVMLQALGGWYGFGLHDFLGTKSVVQNALAAFMPETAKAGRGLVATSPERVLENGAPVFRTGSGSSDVLHALMNRMTLDCVIGHSKGALSIANAVRSLDAARTEGLSIVTLGCPVAKEVKNASYHQYLGLFDLLGQTNAWGNWPDTWLPTSHSTNTAMAMSMHVGELSARAKPVLQ